jgi:hypothetical protein
MARKTPKNPDEGATRTPEERVPQERQPTIPKAKHLGGNTYCIVGPAQTSKRPRPKKHRKTKPQ